MSNPSGGSSPRYASFLRRAAAHIIDGIIIQCCLGFFLFGLIDAPAHGNAAIAGSAVVQLLFSWIYYASLESSRNSATLGKLLLGIKVTSSDGQRLTFSEASGRFLGKILSGITIVGYLLPLFTERKQALHDLLADTVVVRSEE